MTNALGWLALVVALVACIPATLEGVRRYRHRFDFVSASGKAVMIKKPDVVGAKEKVVTVEEAVFRLTAVQPRLRARDSELPLVQLSPTKLDTLLAFNRNANSTIVLPSLRGEDSHRAVTVEDLNAIVGLIASAPVTFGPSSQPYIDLAERMMTDISTANGNLLSVCSSRRNPVTGELLKEHERLGGIRCEFLPVLGDSGEQRHQLVVDGDTYDSPLDELLRRHAADPLRMTEPFADFALVARVRNPWDLACSALIVAGIRAVGTQGAASFLVNAPDQFLERSNGKDFIAVVRVETESLEKEFFDGHIVKFHTVNDRSAAEATQ